MIRLVFLALALSALSACKLHVFSLPGGEVQSGASGTCPESTICVHNIADSTFTETFEAVPAPGYRFIEWKDGGTDFVCGGSSAPICSVQSTILAGILPDAAIAAAPDIYLMPIFSDRAPLPNTVMLAGKEWAQPTSFSSMTWDEINAVCPVDQGGVCTGSLQGYDLTGWTWATRDDLLQLFDFYAPDWTDDIYPALTPTRVNYYDPPIPGVIPYYYRAYIGWTADEFSEIEAFFMQASFEERDSGISRVSVNFSDAEKRLDIAGFFFKTP